MSLPAIIEAVIFSSDSSVTLDKLAEMLPEFERGAIRDTVSRLVHEHETREGGLQLTEVAGGWQFRTRPGLQQYVMRHLKIRPVKFSQSAMETLAIIAYRQPVTRSEIEHLRGVDCGAVLKSLLEKKLARILGKKDIPGRPLIYGTTKDFLEVFGLKDLKGLPTLKEIQALDDMPIAERQEELPLDDSAESMASAQDQELFNHQTE